MIFIIKINKIKKIKDIEDRLGGSQICLVEVSEKETRENGGK